MRNDKLTDYRKRRDFTRTPEPQGRGSVKTASQLRFVIQKHAATRLHYDLRLELDGVFKSWAVTRPPSLDPQVKRLAVEVEDHPLDYGDFEGTIPKGEYGGGTVQLWDRGFWAPEGDVAPERALRDGELKFVLAGERLQGRFVLVRIRDREGGKRQNWLLIKHGREQIEPQGAPLDEDRSVASGRTMEQIAAGRGAAPRPFMLSTQAPADAVWHSKRTEPSAAALREAPAPVRGRPIKTLPSFIAPQLCTLLERPPTDAGWVHEVKLDGYRLQLRVSGGHGHLRTRKGLDWTEKFPMIAAEAAALPDCIIDGEAVALDAGGAPSFAALQAALSEERTSNVVFFAFDLLCTKGLDLQERPLLERKAALQELLATSALEHVRFVEHFETRGDAVLRSACEMGLEGIVSKRRDAPYRSGRAGTWTKTKCRAGHEVVIGGWSARERSVSSLLVGVMRGSHLAYVGRVGTGFSEQTARELLLRLRPLATPHSPFVGENAPRPAQDVHWVAPQLVAEIEFAGWTDSGMVRQAAFKALREDKPAREVVAELPAPARKVATPSNSVAGKETTMRRSSTRAAAKVAKKTAGKTRKKTAGTSPRSAAGARARGTGSQKRTVPRASEPPVARASVAAAPAVAAAPRSGTPVVLGVKISNPDKPLWPARDGQSPITKLELAEYFATIGDWMIQHLHGRPCSLIRAPDGIDGQHFFQRHAMAGASPLFTFVRVAGDRQPYLQLDRVEALIAAAQSAALELHPWNCQPGEPEVPGRLVFDLDPAPDVAFDQVIAAATELRDRLAAVQLQSFCKTTGGKGLHVVTPLKSGERLDWATAKAFAQTVCAQMAADSPDRFLIQMAKNARGGRIFLDYLRNDQLATAVAPLSPRVRAGAPVSMPLNWSQVRSGLAPERFTLRSAPQLLAASRAWREYSGAARSLVAAVRRLTGSSSKPKRGRG